MHRGSKRGGINIKQLHSSAVTILEESMHCRGSAKSSQTNKLFAVFGNQD